MNLSEVLSASMQPELVVPQDIETLPAIAYSSVGKRNAHELLQGYVGLPKIYEYAAWLCLETMQTGIKEAGLEASRHAQEKYLDPTGPALAGTATMVRYLSLLPYVYAGQRKDFNEAPLQFGEQVKELRGIAHRSVGHLRTIAQQQIGVSGVLERNGYLRSSEPKSRRAEYEDANHAYTLQQGDNGLFVGGRFSIDSTVQILEKNWQHDHPQQRLHKVGCVALRYADISSGVNLFDTMWHRLVDLASSDERFYAQDLLAIAATHGEVDYK